jgi:hypothetical protein
MKAKEFLDIKQNEHFKKFKEHADFSKLTEWIEEYTNNFHKSESITLKKLSSIIQDSSWKL